ncbi:DUF2207 domain-containing protein [bacterium]|nr:DUF2207 domain-containing protein [bacterium]
MTRRAARGVLALLALLVVASAARADLGGYTIAEFETQLTVEPDAELLVEERLAVDFSEPRHGIYRLIPYAYTDPRGFQYRMRLRLESVVDEHGNPYGTKVSREGDHYRIRIGDADRTITGRVIYRIRYRVQDALGHFPQYDELYWNATGHEWQADIGRATATVRLPAALPADSLRALGFTGRFGATAQEVTIAFPEPGRVHFEATRALGPLEGLTVVVAFPRGHLRFPGAAVRVARFVGANLILLAPFVWLALLVRLYRARGKDPAVAGSVTVRYEPPEGLSAAELGALVDERVDLGDITATIVDLAVKGRLAIEEREESSLLGLIKREETRFARRGRADAGDLLPHEAQVWNGIFKHGEQVDASDLRQEFYKEIPPIREAVVQRLVRGGYFEAAPTAVYARYGGFGVLAGLATFGLGALLSWITGGLFPQALALPIVAAVLSMVLFFAFAPAMPRRTKKGVAGREWALGFQEFATRVEADRIERELADPAARRAAFERLLPYAMALGVAAAWARRFQGIYDEGPAPGWYRGPGLHGGFSTVSLEKSLSAAMASAGRAMAATPRSSGSSGSGGGGFSGGGGGGGGGGSW